jgi:hypothetical protein
VTKKPNRTRKNRLHVMLNDEEQAILRAWMELESTDSTSDAVRRWINGMKRKLQSSD